MSRKSRSRPSDAKELPLADEAAPVLPQSLTGGDPLIAKSAADLSGKEAASIDHQAAMYAAAERGDTAEFERLRDGGVK